MTIAIAFARLATALLAKRATSATLTSEASANPARGAEVASTALPITQIGPGTPFSVTTIRLSGASGEAAILAADVTSQTTFYDGIGTLSLNVFSPTLLLVLDGTVAIPPSGMIDLTFVVPPASGVTINLQGVLIPANWPDLLITNVLPFTIP